LPTAPAQLAYIIYTSGSTGQPWVLPSRTPGDQPGRRMQQQPDCADDCLLAITTFAFDMSVVELFAPLCTVTL
jgi:non-ribosomal peptide synthetase component F